MFKDKNNEGIYTLDFKGKTSSNIISMEYDIYRRVLQVMFKNDRKYHYFEVPGSLVLDFQDRVMGHGASIGKTFKDLIIDGDFDYAEVLTDA